MWNSGQCGYCTRDWQWPWGSAWLGIIRVGSATVTRFSRPCGIFTRPSYLLTPSPVRWQYSFVWYIYSPLGNDEILLITMRQYIEWWYDGNDVLQRPTRVHGRFPKGANTASPCNFWKAKEIDEVWRPSGPWLPAESPSGHLTLSVVPFGCSSRVTHKEPE